MRLIYVTDKKHEVDMKKYVLIALIILTGSAISEARDLYKVIISSDTEAITLESLEAEPVFLLPDGYLVLIDGAVAEVLESNLQSARLLESDIEVHQLAIDRRHDRSNTGKYPLIFEQDNFRLYRVDWSSLKNPDEAIEIVPIRSQNLRIEYRRPKIYNAYANLGEANLDSLIGLVNQDSVEAYLHRLEDFQTRLTGTDSCNAARDWIAGKFASFGYDSIVIDPFTGSQLWDYDPVQSYNVIATKVGSRFPDRQIVVGAHFDAVPNCPGVDDNGTGTTGVLEIARVLKDIETEMTFIFIAFDSEESWMWGSYDYADSVGALGKNIIYMQNLDMIGHFTNDSAADLYYGSEISYSALWKDLADSLVGIEGSLSGYEASDHTPFIDNGYDVTFVQEFDFSTNYHRPSDSTTYINFDYMTRMIKASLATDYIVNLSLAPIELVSILDVGNGQSLQITWEPGDPSQVDHYTLYYGTEPHSTSDSVHISKDSIRYIVDGLQEGVEYYMHIIAYDDRGMTSIAYDELSGIPYSIPSPPRDLTALPIVDGIQLSWYGDNQELDFDHYQILRDSLLLPDFIYDTEYTDWGPNLGSDFHYYWIVSIDNDGNTSDTSGIEPVFTRAATLRPNEILAINRTGSNTSGMVIESVTGELIREALGDLSFDYISDTAHANPDRANLLDFIDYGLIVIGAEAARQDDIGNVPEFGGILDDIAYYLSIGGKAIIFGRWGDITIDTLIVDTLHYSQSMGVNVYRDYFNISERIIPRTVINSHELILESDFIGAHTQVSGYPELVWDSLAAAMHSGTLSDITGVPCPSFCSIDLSADAEVIYTYNSSTDFLLTEGKPVAWRNAGGPYDYVFFEIPLSFMDRGTAVTALRQAFGDMGIISDVDDYAGNLPLPDKFSLAQNYPNPFNPSTIIEFYNPEPRPVKVSLEVFNILGQQVRVLFNDAAVPGWNRVEWDGYDKSGKSIASGIYFYRFKASDFEETKKMLLLR